MRCGLTRRDFLGLCALSTGALAFLPELPPEDRGLPIGHGRVTNTRIHIYAEPSFQSDRLDDRRRDHLLPIFEEIHSPHGPEHNPTWYRVMGGFAHSGFLQRVETRYNPVLDTLPTRGRVFTVTVPYVQALRYTRASGWRPLYRLYYGSQHWVTGVDSGPDGRPWYRITDERLRVDYFVPAHVMRPIPYAELTPLSPRVPPEEKRIEISLTDQTLTAYEENRIVFHTRISSGLPSRGPSPNGIPTETPTGRFNVSRKMPVRHMGDGELTADHRAYELPGVPWCCFFVSTGVATHGTYWHNHFGRRMSHGCVNMRNEDAQWVYRWTTPTTRFHDWYRAGRGTVIDVVE